LTEALALPFSSTLTRTFAGQCSVDGGFGKGLDAAIANFSAFIERIYGSLLFLYCGLFTTRTLYTLPSFSSSKSTLPTQV